MGHRPLQKMPIEERAKQFMPFAALKGLPEALARAEQLAEHRGETVREKLDENGEEPIQER